jgi:isoquinoline 1-oxidoreductase alpha subunit
MYRISINGLMREVDGPADMPLLWALRDNLNLTGTKYGCGAALCGACTILIDGQPVRACQTAIGDIGNGKVITIEGAAGRVAEAIQHAWLALDVPQCGYCQSGQIMAATALLSTNNNPSDADIDAAMSGNICRCATYARIRDAVKDAAKAIRA